MRKVVAQVKIKDAAEMTTRERRAVAAWLKQHAADIVKDGKEYDRNFKGRIYL